MDKDFYNKSSADSLGWDPSWFGCEEFDYVLVKAVQKWQKENGLKADGLVGPATYRRIWTERESKISDWMDALPLKRNYREGEKYIVHNSKFIPIEWDKVILWDEANGFKANEGCYTSYAGKPDRKPTMFVNHWDVCLSAESCAKVLNRRGISVHFLIDNDGTIFQMLDTQHKAWHAGIPNYEGGNTKGIGVEISNAYYTKYQEWYVKQDYGERPIQEHGYVHGRTLKPFLDFYPVQLEALKALWKAIHIGVGIPLEYPKNSKGHIETSVHKDCERGKFNGFCNHYNFIKTKIDCAGLDLPKLLEEVKSTPMYCLD
tara:strand:+ start:3550 stop:4497 length:948 start_codon:yes stop_codon:yes gene_type:complete